MTGTKEHAIWLRSCAMAVREAGAEHRLSLTSAEPAGIRDGRDAGAAMSPVLVEAVGSLAAVVTTFCWIPQAIRVIRTRETRAISLLAQLALFLGVLLWLAYGVLIGSAPLIWSNVFTAVIVGVIVALKLRYG